VDVSIFFPAGASGDWASWVARAVSLVAGVWLLWSALRSAVVVMLVPRPTYPPLVRLVAHTTRAIFDVFARRCRTYAELDRVLAVQGPVTVLFFLGMFLGIFVASFGCIFYGIGGLSFSHALARAGSSMTTLGFDEAHGLWGMAVMIVAAFMGSTVISVFIGFLLTLYAAYTFRETGITELALLTGEPPWGPEMLVRAIRTGGGLGEPRDLEKWITWMCNLRVSHYIYSILNHFRSPLPRRHWVLSILAILDAAAIRIAAGQGAPDLALVRIIAEGSETLQMLRRSQMERFASIHDYEPLGTWDIEAEILSPDHHGKPTPDPGITREEWDWAMQFLESNGFPLKSARDEAWESFCWLREHYHNAAYYLASELCAVPAPWSGPRPKMHREAAVTLWPELGGRHPAGPRV